MTLQDLYEQLAFNELSNLHLVVEGEVGVLKPEFQKAILSHANLGLNALYKRFLLKEGELTLRLIDGITSYTLTEDFAENSLSSIEDIQYIEDSEDFPFTGDIIKIERVYTDSGYELGLNDLGNSLSLRTSSMNTLVVPKLIVDKDEKLPSHLKTDRLRVVYRADHPKLVYKEDNFRPDRINIELPYSHIEALTYFIASRVHNPLGMEENFHAGNSYAAKYERVCQALEANNFRIDSEDQTNSRLHRNGWV